MEILLSDLKGGKKNLFFKSFFFYNYNIKYLFNIFPASVPNTAFS